MVVCLDGYSLLSMIVETVMVAQGLEVVMEETVEELVLLAKSVVVAVQVSLEGQVEGLDIVPRGRLNSPGKLEPEAMTFEDTASTLSSKSNHTDYTTEA